VKIIYHCYGQAHSSITAANLHLGRLPRHRRATLEEICHQPCFDRAEPHQVGWPQLMGTDEWGHAVYVVGLACGRRALQAALRDFLRLSGVAPDEFLLVDALQHAGLPMRVGGYTSRRLGLVWPGRLLTAAGVWLQYPRFCALVEQVRAHLDRSWSFLDNVLDRGEPALPTHGEAVRCDSPPP
jgi:hypothetical protein